MKHSLEGVEVPPRSVAAERAARERQRDLLKPPGSLGRLEVLAIELAAMTAGDFSRLEDPAFAVFAADHGVAQEGVSAYPSEVTAQMVASFLSGGAAISVLARHAGIPMRVVDVGVAGSLPAVSGGEASRRLVQRRVRDGTRNFAVEPALTPEEVRAACAVGFEEVLEMVDCGAGLVGLGEMGIGNTTSAAAVLAACTRCEIGAVIGSGTGIDPAGLARKAAVVAAALEKHQPDPTDPIDVLAKVGGLEIAALAGGMVAAASRRIPVLLDGFIASAAAVVADLLAPGARGYLIATHRSCEPGHGVALAHLGLDPLVQLDLRLGEASGAAVALPLVLAAMRLHRDMATFGEAGVTGAP